MKAAFLEHTGSPDVIQFGEIPQPTPKDNEVLVQVGAASVNPIDTYIRSGTVQMKLPLPFIPGCDLAGTVVAVGPQAKHYKAGDRVWGSNQGLLGRQGTSAQYASVPEDFLYPTPIGVKDEEVAALALVGITAHLGLFQFAHTVRGDTVFVNGGAGGVGSAVVQMATAVGARVITTVGSPEKAALARELGADVVINYKTENVIEAVQKATEGRGVQVWYETQPPSDLDKMIEAMAARGRIVVMAGRAARPVFPNGPFYVKGLSLFGFAMFNIPASEQRICAQDINRFLSEKKLRAHIGTRFPLDQLAQAHRLQEENTLKKSGSLSGKIIILPG